MEISAQQVKELREKTGAGMMDCKKALVASDGDFDKAIEFLREKGLAAAAKKAGRIAAEGSVYAKVCSRRGLGVMVEVNSETDFVSKNPDFQNFCSDVAKVILNEDPADVEALLNCKYIDSDLSVADMLREKVLTMGENIQIRRFVLYTADTTNVAYVHMGGRIGVLAAFEVSDNLKGNEAIIELGRDVCMQIAAMRPQWLCKNCVPAETLEKEKEILLAQTINEGKPKAVAEKIVEGRISKFFEENCLLEQAFVKENKVSVGKHIEQVAAGLGGTIVAVKFDRFEKGEGIEKRSDNLAEEVAKLTSC